MVGPEGGNFWKSNTSNTKIEAVFGSKSIILKFGCLKTSLLTPLQNKSESFVVFASWFDKGKIVWFNVIE